MNPLLIDIPDRLETERLLLRVPRAGDGELVYASVRESIEELKRWMPWATDAYAATDAEEWCRRCAAQFGLREQIAFLLFDRQGVHLGNLSAFKLVWDVPKCEIGYWVRTSRTGQGYCGEAVRAVTRLFVDEMKFSRIEIRTDDRNERSARVAERAGFQLEGVLRNECRDHQGELRGTRVYSIVSARPDSQAR